MMNIYILSLLAALTLSSRAQEVGAPLSADFEEPPTLNSALILQSKLLTGLNYSADFYCSRVSFFSGGGCDQSWPSMCRVTCGTIFKLSGLTLSIVSPPVCQ